MTISVIEMSAVITETHTAPQCHPLEGGPFSSTITCRGAVSISFQRKDQEDRTMMKDDTNMKADVHAQ